MKFISIATMHRAGSGFLSYLLASSDEIMTLPDTTSSTFHKLNINEFFSKKTQRTQIKNFIQRNLLVFDPLKEKKRAEKLGWTHLGKKKNLSFTVDKNLFSKLLTKELNNSYPSFPNLVVAIHKAYYKTRGEDVHQRKTIVLGTHLLDNAINIYQNLLPNHITVLCVRDPVASFFSRFDMEKKINCENINFDFFHSLLTYSMQCQFIRLLKPENLIVIRLEDLHKKFPKYLRFLCSKLSLKFTDKMTVPSINGNTWNGEYWSSGLRTGSTNFNIIKKRNTDKINQYKEEISQIFQYISIDARDLYPETYMRNSLPLIIIKALFSWNIKSISSHLFKRDIQNTEQIYFKLKIFLLNLIKLFSIRIFFLQGVLGLFFYRIFNSGYFFIRYGDITNILRIAKRKLYEL